MTRHYVSTEVVAHGAVVLGAGVTAVGCLTGAGTVVCTGTGTAVTVTAADGNPTNEIQAGLNFFARAAEFGLRSYNELRGLIQGQGLRAHHIIEQRFASTLGLDRGAMTSVALTPEEHQVFTNMWRAYIGYNGSNAAITTANATIDDIWFAAQQIYANHPELLEAARQTLFGP